MWRLLLILLLLFGWGGCASSKWAMNDPDYAAKYDDPYPDDRLKKTHRMAKQIVDARHVEGESGLYGGAAFAEEPTSAGVELGGFGYPKSWLSTRLGLSFLAGTGAKDLFTGANLGARVQIPSRFSPFVGTGVYGGFSQKTIEHDCGCRERTADEGFAAIYPEVGTHFWLTGQWRLTTSAAYFFNTEGRNEDFWFFGISLGRLYNADDTADELEYIPE